MLSILGYEHNLEEPAICLYRQQQQIDGPLFLGIDTHALSESAFASALEVLAAEMTAVMGRDPAELYQQLTRELGEPVYQRLDAPATPEQKSLLAQLSPQQVTARELAGEKITGMHTTAPGDDAPMGGLKVTTANGWFAARPSGTEDVYKIYAESFQGEDHLHRLLDDAQTLIDKALAITPGPNSGGGHP